MEQIFVGLHVVPDLGVVACGYFVLSLGTTFKINYIFPKIYSTLAFN